MAVRATIDSYGDRRSRADVAYLIAEKVRQYVEQQCPIAAITTMPAE
jgi:hypothetical protein